MPILETRQQPEINNDNYKYEVIECANSFIFTISMGAFFYYAQLYEIYRYISKDMKNIFDVVESN